MLHILNFYYLSTSTYWSVLSSPSICLCLLFESVLFESVLYRLRERIRQFNMDCLVDGV